MSDLWSHQAEAVEHALSMPAAYLHQWMGTGKSRVVVEVANQTDAKRTLVIAPLAVIPAWEEQFAMFGSGQVVTLLNKGLVRARTARMVKAITEEGARSVCVINPESFWRTPIYKAIRSTVWDLLVFDEAHKIKSPGGSASRAAYKIPALRKLGLSGTMLPHSPLDAYGQFRALDPTIFGLSFTRFRARYAQMGGFQGHEILGFQNQDELGEKIATITYQCGKDVLDLPPVTEQTVRVDLEPAAMRAYKQMEKTLAAEVGDGELTAANGLVKLLRLQQITGGFLVDDEGDEQVVGESKLKALTELMEGTPVDEPWVVFCRFRRDLDQVHAASNALQRVSLELSGRVNRLEEWKAGVGSILAVQIQAGGVGVDLTRAAYCAYMSTGFSLGDFLQSKERVHRPGQTRHTHYYFIVARDTIDEKVYGALRAKREAVNVVIDYMRGLK